MPILDHSKLLSIAADFRTVYGACAAKKIARDFGIAIATATLWLSGNIPASRRRQIAAGLIVELDRQAAQRAEIRGRLLEIAEARVGLRNVDNGETAARLRARARRSDSD